MFSEIGFTWMKIRKVEPKNWIFPSDSINLKEFFFQKLLTHLTKIGLGLNSLYEQKKNLNLTVFYKAAL